MKFILTTFLACVSVVASGLSFSSTAVAADVVDNALRFEINQTGFNEIARSLQHHLLSDLHDEPIPDMDEQVGFGIQAKLKRMTYSLTVKNFALIPDQGKIRAVLDLSDVVVSIPTARFSKNVGFEMVSTCKKTFIRAGQRAGIRLVVELATSVADGKVVVTPANVNLNMPWEEFDVDGPEVCGGSLGIGHVIKFAINRALTYARTSIADRLENKVKETIPALAQQINEAIIRDIPVRFGQNDDSLLRDIVISARPYEASVSPTGAVFALSADIREAAAKDQAFAIDANFGDDTQRLLGQFGLRTELLNQLLAKTFRPYPATIEVPTTTNSVAREIFSRTGLSSIIPDINTVQMDSDTISAKVGFDVSPTISVERQEDGGVALKLNIRGMRLLMEITRGGKKIPYFELIFNAMAHIRLKINKGQLTFEFETPTSIEVDGKWADGYTPDNPLFERDVANTIFFAALEILCKGGVLARFEVPEFRMTPDTVGTIVAPRFDNGFVMVQVVAKPAAFSFGASPDVTGVWDSGCAIKTNTDGRKYGIHESKNFTERYKSSYTSYGDMGCKQPASTLDFYGTWRIADTDGDLVQFDVVMERALMTPNHSMIVWAWNNTNLCGISDWTLNVTRDVTGLHCGSGGDIPRRGDVIYDLARVTDNKMYSSIFDNGHNGRSPSQRPESVNEQWFMRRQ